jgi:chaperonin GroES
VPGPASDTQSDTADRATAGDSDPETELRPERDTPGAAAPAGNGGAAARRRDKLAIKMLNDRVLVRVDQGEGERTSSGGILIPATANISRRLAWAEVVAAGPNVRAMQVGDHVLFNPEDRYEVEVRGEDYIILRERDVHALASTRLGEASTGLYL